MAVISIEIPARPEYVSVVRLAIGALARSEGLDQNRVDDLKTAISEACTNAVMASAEGGTSGVISTSWSLEGSSIVVEMTDPSPHHEPKTSDDTLSFSNRAVMSEALLRSLVDGYEVRAVEAGSVTRLTLNR